MGVSVDALRSEIKQYNYEVITGGDDAVAQDKKEDAMELLKAYYGNAVDSSGYASGSPDAQKPLATGAVKKCSHTR